MNISYALILSQDIEIIRLCDEVGNEIGLKMERIPELADFILALQEKDYVMALFDCIHVNELTLNWVKVVRKVRPKLPLIIFSDEVNQKTGGKIYDEGTFYLCLRPVQKRVLHNVLSAALAQNHTTANHNQKSN
jgi:DNA-binding NtrC family response regulator